jgi:excisionase family DNA binding protein
MAGMFCTLQEAATKLGKSEADVKQMVQAGKLREYRDGSKVVFKLSDVDALVAADILPEGSSIGLTPLDDTAPGANAPVPPAAKTKTGTGASDSVAPILDLGEDDFDLSKADTQLTGQGVNVLGESDSEFKITDDPMAKTHAAASKAAQEPSLEKIEEDVNLDSFGSGSGLLDLSLQADDTSLGNVLDDIYPGADLPASPDAAAAPAAAAAAAPVDVAAEAEQIFTEAETTSAKAASITAAYAEPEPDTSSNILGFVLILPLLAAIYTFIIAAAAVNNVMPTVLTAVQDIFWYIIAGAGVLALIIIVAGFAVGSKKAVKSA